MASIRNRSPAASPRAAVGAYNEQNIRTHPHTGQRHHRVVSGCPPEICCGHTFRASVWSRCPTTKPPHDSHLASHTASKSQCQGSSAFTSFGSGPGLRSVPSPTPLDQPRATVSRRLESIGYSPMHLRLGKRQTSYSWRPATRRRRFAQRPYLSRAGRWTVSIHPHWGSPSTGGSGRSRDPDMALAGVRPF